MVLIANDLIREAIVWHAHATELDHTTTTVLVNLLNRQDKRANRGLRADWFYYGCG